MDKNTPVEIDGNRIWLDNGILYNEYHDDLAIKSIIKVEVASLELIQKAQIELLPMIVLLVNMKPGSFKLGPSDFGKILSSVDLLNHMTCIYVVGADEDFKKKASIMNKIFFGDKVQFIDSLKEAQAEAQKTIEAGVSLFEED